MYAYILLTHSNTVPAKLVRLWTGDVYSHVAVSLDSPMIAYSFGRKSKLNFLNGGFIEEQFATMDPETQISILRLPMTQKAYYRARILLAYFQDYSDCYHYNFKGIVGIMLHRKINGKNAYFCSQFVSTLLEKSGAYCFSKPACFIKPSDFLKLNEAEILYSGTMRNYWSSNADLNGSAAAAQWA
ncbi:hypothetical protein NIE88_01905 [Sporolactobacillus shoreicorticis]|uniref:Permuted papain-like amidase YaeF/Yiix C92 family enzyme n=1 Tax=Sporolactobacillus shoreicorticis TaxID=1923877 RepID=A0ABW5S2P6_9BACL|nr:hypothetical protein [Sporolactobacillus shoreicorticis]MCO7124533.1 hypothetical protein [Sporolactobacillus shoreicorticis]